MASLDVPMLRTSLSGRFHVVALILVSPLSSLAAPLVLDGTRVLGPCSVTLGGAQTFNSVRLISGARLYVTGYNGTDRINTGNLVLKSDSISVDQTRDGHNPLAQENA